jgi:hypothetical protein
VRVVPIDEIDVRAGEQGSDGIDLAGVRFGGVLGTGVTEPVKRSETSGRSTWGYLSSDSILDGV